MASTINGTSTGNGGLISTGDDSGILNIQTNETTAITVDASQNVGIGTSSPVARLHVSGTTDATQRIIVNGSGNYSSIKLQYNGTEIAQFQTYQNSEITIGSTVSAPLMLVTNNTERARIDSSGNLLVNSTTTLNAVFNVTGKSGVSPCSLRVNTDGDYGYTFKNASNTLVGAIGVNASTTSYNTSSDYRLKENIVPMTGALATVSQLKPVTYKWKSTGEESQGFIAHELQEVVPDCVTGTKDELDAEGNPKYQGIDTSFLVATLTAALQETKALIDTQAETINALTARIEAMENK